MGQPTWENSGGAHPELFEAISMTAYESKNTLRTINENCCGQV